MVTQADVRRIALALPGTSQDADGRFAFAVDNKPKPKGFAWVWMERVAPKKPRVANPAVLAIRVPNMDERATLLAADPDKFFTEPHYNGFPAVLVRIAKVRRGEMEKLLGDAWRCQASRALVDAYEASASKPRASKPRAPRRRRARRASTSRAR